MLAKTCHMLLLLGFASLLAVAAISDIKGFIIPNAISLILIIGFPLYWLAANTISGGSLSLFGALVAGVIVFLVTFALYAFGLFGAGDVKLLTALAFWAGTAHIAVIVVNIALIGGVLAIGILVTRLWKSRRPDATDTAASLGKTPMPYGVAISAGGIWFASNLLQQYFLN
jgi:prepilin peptidase CpaA